MTIELDQNTHQVDLSERASREKKESPPPLSFSLPEWGEWLIHHSSTRMVDELITFPELMSLSKLASQDQWPAYIQLQAVDERGVPIEFTFTSRQDLYEQIGRFVQKAFFIKVLVSRGIDNVTEVAQAAGFVYHKGVPLEKQIDQLTLPRTIAVGATTLTLYDQVELLRAMGEVSDRAKVRALLKYKQRANFAAISYLFGSDATTPDEFVRELATLVYPAYVIDPLTKERITLLNKGEAYAYVIALGKNLKNLRVEEHRENKKALNND